MAAISLRKLLAILAAMAAMVASAEDCDETPAASKPKIVPPGWIANYDHQTNPLEYLRAEYQEAKTEGLNLYVFFYADWCKPCRRIRTKIERRPTLQRIFAGRRIVMMEMTRVNCLVTAATGGPAPIDFVPMLVKVNADGSLGSGIEPDQWNESPLSVTIRKLQRFLDQNDDT